MKNKNIWVLTNVPEEIRDIARDNAKKENKTISGWVSDAINTHSITQQSDFRAILQDIDRRISLVAASHESSKGKEWWRRRK